MTPIEQAAAVYDREPCVRTFNEDLHGHYLNGFVLSTQDIFYMARPVNKSAPGRDICNPYVRFAPEECDCWHVYMFAGKGNMMDLFKHAPQVYPWASFERHNKLKFYRWEVIQRGCKQFA
jgi:hypothetical protein